MPLPWTRLSLRSVLVGAVLVAGLPAALLMTWHATLEVKAQSAQMHSHLAWTADTVAQAVASDLGQARHVEAGRWQALLAAAAQGDKAGVALFDAQHQRLAVAGRVAVASLPSDVGDGARVQLADGFYDIAWRPVPGTDWRLAIGVPSALLDARHLSIVAGSLAWTALSLVLGALLALWAARFVVGPLHGLGRAGDDPDKRGPGDDSTAVRRVAIREIQQLREALAAGRQREAAALATLRHKADELQALFQASPVGLSVLLDAPTPQRSVNPAWQRLLGDDGRGPLPALRQGERLLPIHEHPLQRAARNDEEVPPMLLSLDTGGQERWLMKQAVPLRQADGTPRGAIAVAHDVTEQHLAERERAAASRREQRARREAQAASRSKDELLSMLNHELRNPLNAITAAVEVMNLPGGDERSREEARATITRQTRRLSAMLNDLLLAAAAVSGEVVLSRAPVALGAAVAAALESARRLADQHLPPGADGPATRRVIHFHIDEVWVFADPARIEQIAAQLIANALKHTPAPGEIAVAVRAVGERAIEVRDSGQGIPPALLPQVFDAFVQGPQPLARQGGGLGLGLTLARALARMHGGSVSAESSPQGSVFRVELPRIEAPAAESVPLPVPAAGARHGSAPRAGARSVLLVEDNGDALQAMRTALESDGHQVSTAPDGGSGLRALLDQRPEVAIIDIGLPGLDGLQLARLGRGAGYGGRLVALSGYGRDIHVQQAMRAGFDVHLDKPVDFARLREVLAAGF